MSLLLNALKKSGDPDPKSRERVELLLEETSPRPPKAQSTPADIPHEAPVKPAQPDPRPASSNTGNAATPTRAAGENLFAAKKPLPAKKRRLGIIPIVLIGGGIFALTGGIYVYLEITPPQQRPFYSPPIKRIATTAPAPAPIAKPQPTAVAAPIIPVLVAPVSAPAVAPPVVEAKPDGFPSPGKPSKNRPKAAAHVEKRSKLASKAETSAQPVEIQHKLTPNVIDALLSAAYHSYQTGDYIMAAQQYRDVLSQDGQNRDALLGLAVIAQQKGQDAAALHYYRLVLALDPNDAVAQAGLASYSSGDAASKESRLKQLIAQQPDSAALYFTLGNQYVEQSRWPEAKHAFSNALALEPANALFAFNVAVSLDHLGQRSAAAHHYQHALTFDPTGVAGFDHAQVERRLKELHAR